MIARLIVLAAPLRNIFLRTTKIASHTSEVLPEWRRVLNRITTVINLKKYKRNSLSRTSDGLIKFHKESVKYNGPTLLCKPFNLLITEFWVNLRSSTDCLRSNLVAVWVDTQLKNSFGIHLFLGHWVFKTEGKQQIIKK